MNFFFKRCYLQGSISVGPITWKPSVSHLNGRSMWRHGYDLDQRQTQGADASGKTSARSVFALLWDETIGAAGRRRRASTDELLTALPRRSRSSSVFMGEKYISTM